MYSTLKNFLIVSTILLQGCYTIGTVQYPTYDINTAKESPALVIQNTAFVRSVDGKDVTPSFWNKMARNIVPLLTLGKIENQVLVQPGAHTLDVGYYDSSSSTVNYGSYKQTTTTTRTLAGVMECNVASGKRYDFESNWETSHIALKPEGDSKPICTAHR